MPDSAAPKTNQFPKKAKTPQLSLLSSHFSALTAIRSRAAPAPGALQLTLALALSRLPT